MLSIVDLLESGQKLEGVKRHEPVWETITEKSKFSQRNTAPGQYENEVFHYLFQNRKPLGIKEVRKAKNAKVDGAIVLRDDKVIPIEIKYKMNWEKACQATWQIFRYYETYPSEGAKFGLVVFKDFSGDWKNQPLNREHKYGWIRWYSEHVKENDLELHLVQLKDGNIQLGPPQY